MNDTRLETIDQIEAFLSATQTLEFSIEDKTERYEWIQCTLVRFNYRRLSKAEKGGVMQENYRLFASPNETLDQTIP